MNLGLGILLSLPAPLGALWVYSRVRKVLLFEPRWVWLAAVLGLFGAALTLYIEQLVLGWLGIGIGFQASSSLDAALAVFLFAAPLEEAAKVACLWWFYTYGKITSQRIGLLYGVAVGASFGLVEIVLGSRGLSFSSSAISSLWLGLPVHWFCSGLWGYWLGRGRRRRGRGFGVAWFISVLIHGLYVALITAESAQAVASAIPLALTMLGAGWVTLRDMDPASASSRAGSAGSGAWPLPEPPSLRTMQRALQRTDRPIMVHWIFLGGLVTLGVMLVNLALAVWLGHQLEIDFSHAEKSGAEAGGPLLLLGSAILLAFPFAGFLVARASDATSVLEPALGACIAIVLLAFTLAVSTSSGVLMSLGLAPVAFLLACLGAWFGTSS